jgi:hypothetical protein
MPKYIFLVTFEAPDDVTADFTGKDLGKHLVNFALGESIQGVTFGKVKKDIANDRDLC